MARLPAYAPQLAALAAEAPSGGRWLHEIKYDGYRLGARVERGEVRLVSRRGGDWTARFPGVRDAVGALPCRAALLDGEVAAVLADGRTSFQALQRALGGARGARLAYFAFDLLHLDGEDLAARPLEDRKAALARLLARAPRDGPLRVAEAFPGDGPAVFREACRLGLEGIVSKRRDVPYRAVRGGGWLKVKCQARQELVVGGFTDEGGSPSDLGALLVGVPRPGSGLAFAGKVGAGFGSRAEARALRARVAALASEACPFVPRPPGWLGRHAHWVRPELVAEVGFTEWTADGKVRNPIFRGWRDDRPAEEVVVERAVGKTSSPVVGGVAVSHASRVLDPTTGATKLDLVRYYDAVAEAMLPHLAGRPLTLLHCPTGLGSCRFLRHGKQWAPSSVRRVRIAGTKVGEYLVVDDRAALLAVAQMGIVELHTWNTRAGRLEEPDRLVLDLDPGPEVPWRDVVAAALAVRDALRALRLESVVKTTGGAGLHVVVPLTPERPWSDALAFSRGLAAALAASDPARYTTSFARRGRERRILLDYLRNNRTNTSVAAFSARARPGLPVSVPLAWEELDRRRPQRFDIRSVPRRLARLRRDPWAGAERRAQRLSDQVLAAVAAASGRRASEHRA
ncbi:MAG TPA: DNA ligase D [Anaeromyxobacteraceae bacterium]|nr:DNA ligase D [Anaeromyxobacteraceae bacterium]